MSLRTRIGARASHLVERVRTRRRQREESQPTGDSSSFDADAPHTSTAEHHPSAEQNPHSGGKATTFGRSDAPSAPSTGTIPEPASGTFPKATDAPSKSPLAIAEEFYYQLAPGLDPRGRVSRVKTTRAHRDRSRPETRMYLISADTARYHLSHVFRTQFDYEERLEQTSAGETLRLYWSEGVPIGAENLLELLTRRIALPLDGLGHLNLLLALDRYKIVDPEVHPNNWMDSKTGSAVNYLKYRKPRALRYSYEPEFKYLVDNMAEAIERHPSYSHATTLVSAPGSKETGSSLAEALTAQLADVTGKRMEYVSCPPHEPRKGPNPPNLAGTMSLTSLVSGTCIVIDDVLRTGHTLNETARAARSAGAAAVYGLVAAKTMRS